MLSYFKGRWGGAKSVGWNISNNIFADAPLSDSEACKIRPRATEHARDVRVQGRESGGEYTEDVVGWSTC